MHAALARSLKDVFCANNNPFAVIVCFGWAFYPSGMGEKIEIFEFRIFSNIYHYDDVIIDVELAYLRFGVVTLLVE